MTTTTRFEGAGLDGHDAQYVVETYLTLTPASSDDELPEDIWDHLLTDDERFTFARVAPLPEDTPEAALEHWGTRLDALEAQVQFFDRDEQYSIDMLLITCETFPAAWLAALTAKFPVKASGNYAVDVEPDEDDDEDFPDDDEFEIVGGINPYA